MSRNAPESTGEYSAYAAGGARASIAQTWLSADTSDALANERLYGSIRPVVAAYPSARWLTIGDGRFGNDARWLHKRGRFALATDLSDELLQEAVQAGLLPEARREDAEDLSFADRSFDLVLCKESFHHFARPFAALYEMLRVARVGVVLIEPTDRYISDSLPQALFMSLLSLRRTVLRRPALRHEYEEPGNYTYRVSRREFEKVALGLHLPSVAFRGVNNADRGPIGVRMLDSLTVHGLYQPQLLTTFISKEPLNGLKGFDVVSLPEDPA